MSLPMLFCNIELKIYVPDGFEDFMAALSDPRGFMGAQQTQNEQMSSMGIEVAKFYKINQHNLQYSNILRIVTF